MRGSPYYVIVCDLFNLHDPDHETIVAGFPTRELAIEYARRRTWSSVEQMRAPGLSREQVRSRWLALGEDCRVVGPEGVIYAARSELDTFLDHPLPPERSDWLALYRYGGPMTTFREVRLTCAVCGHTDTHTVLTSTSAFGASDLDTRPPPPARLTLPMEVQHCPACGYCARDVSKAPPVAQTVVARQEYQAQLQDRSFPYLANLFLCQSMIQEAAGDYASAGWAALRAAWACDDEGEKYASAAVRCRSRAVAMFAEAHRKGQAFATEPGSEEAILSDVLRRSGRFSEAEEMIERGLALDPAETVRHTLLFQRHLCSRRDAGVYTVNDALNWIKEE